MNTLIKPDDHWSLWMILLGISALAIVLEQKYKWAARMSGPIVALLGTLILANLNIIPGDAPAYDIVWGYIVPIAIPLLLFKANIRNIWRESGRMGILFIFPIIGTCLGAFIATAIFSWAIPEIYKVAGMITGSYIGGGVNFTAMIAVFKPSPDIRSATIVADNFVMALFFFIYMWIPTVNWFRKRFVTQFPLANEQEVSDEEKKVAENHVAAYWDRKEISLKDIAVAMAVAVIIAGGSLKLGQFLGSLFPAPAAGEKASVAVDIIRTILSNQFFIMTTVTVAAVSLFPKFFDNINGAQELGTFLIYIFFTVLATPASLKQIIFDAPWLFIFCAIIALVNLVMTMIGGKLMKVSLEEQMCAANAALGGPTTAAAMAISKGWISLVIPSLLCGILGYVVGNYFGLGMGMFLGKMFGGL
jgi:Predicted integral membrane protein